MIVTWIERYDATKLELTDTRIDNGRNPYIIKRNIWGKREKERTVMIFSNKRSFLANSMTSYMIFFVYWWNYVVWLKLRFRFSVKSSLNAFLYEEKKIRKLMTTPYDIMFLILSLTRIYILTSLRYVRYGEISFYIHLLVSSKEKANPLETKSTCVV